MSGLKISLQGGEKLIAALDKAASKVERKIVTAVYASAFRIQAAARRMAPVDTGRLRSSIFVRFFEGGMSAEVGTDVFYAPYQERRIGYLVPAYEAEMPKFSARIKKIMAEGVT